MPNMPLLKTKEELVELATTSGPKGKYLAKDGLSWIALNKNDEGEAWIKTINAFETFESALQWLEEVK